MTVKMQLPDILSMTLDERDVLAAVNDMCFIGKTSVMACAGAKMSCRAVDALSPTNSLVYDLHYTECQVSIRMGRQKTRRFRKNKPAKLVDARFDSAFDGAVDKFGVPNKWQGKQGKIGVFFVRQMKDLFGLPCTLTSIAQPNKPTKGGTRSHSHDEHGTAKGGHTPKIQCQKRRTERISESLNRAYEKAG